MHDEIQKLINNNEKWADVRVRFLTNFPPSFYPDKAVELLDLCRASQKLRQLSPYISLGRLGLERHDPYEKGYADSFVCLYFHNGSYVVSSYDNEIKCFFDVAQAAIAFVEQHLNDENPFS